MYGGLIQLCKPKTVDYEVLRESIHLLLESAEDYIQTWILIIQSTKMLLKESFIIFIIFSYFPVESFNIV